MHQRRAGQALGERQLELGIFGEHRAHQLHADRLDAGIGHADGDVAGNDASALAHLGLGFRHRAQDDAGVLIEPFAGRGRFHAARLALEQGRCELGLQVRDVMAQRGLRDVHLVGRARQVPLLVDGDEITELARIHDGEAFYNREGNLR